MYAWFEELSDFLMIPSISAEAVHAPDVARAGEWVCELIRGAGGKSAMIAWRGKQVAMREMRAVAGGADVAVIFDSDMIRKGLPAFHTGTRGLLSFHVSLTTGRRDLHSGLYGGAALNAAHALIQTLGAVIAVDGRLTQALRAGVTPPSRAEVEEWQALPAGAEELAAQGARPGDPRAAEELYLR